jgi:uncharacterized protein (DUF2249 family)
MPIEIDLREQPETTPREHLFDAFENAESGEEVTVVAQQDIDPHLIRYQIDHECGLEWEYADPDAEPRELRITLGDTLNDGTHGTIDVRDLKPQRRHNVLLDIFDELEVGEGFVLVNDHDPKPLYHELRSMHGDVVEWEYASRGDGEWRVEIDKTGDSEGTDQDIVTRYDVRDIPKAERHPTIHHRYGMIPEGGTLELIAPHEPRPLQREFRQRYGDSFSWEVVESEPGRCQVQVTKHETRSESDETTEAEDVPAQSSADQEIEVVDELDVRDRPPAERHERIFASYDELDAGTGFILVNDHDPKPLYHQFEAETGPEFHWTYRKREPGEYRVLIGKSEAPVEQGVSGEPEAPF